MQNLNLFSKKSFAIAVLTFGSALGSLAGSAATVTGTATITIDNTAFAAASVYAGGYPNGWIVNTFYDSSYNTTGITSSTVGGETIAPTGPTAMLFPVNTNSTTIAYPSAGDWGRTVQATTMDASNTSVGQIGLSGGWALSGQPGFLSPYDFSLTKTGSTWNIRTNDTGFGYQNFLVLANVSESLNGNGELLLSGDLKWTGLWASLVHADTSAVVGTFSLTPSAPVPVPAAVWLFGSAMAGLLSLGRKKSSISA